MRYYLIDEISLSDMEKINIFLKENTIGSELEKFFWGRIPKDLLTRSSILYGGYGHKKGPYSKHKPDGPPKGQRTGDNLLSLRSSKIDLGRSP